MAEEARFVARYASQYVTGDTFTEVGNVLAERGFDMTAARQTDHGVLIIPHRKPGRISAHLFRQLDPITEAEKLEECDCPPPPVEAEPSPPPMRVDLAAATLAGAEVEAGVRDGVGLKCRECGAVHPEGMVCMIPVMYEKRCCLEQTYAHDGPHEAGHHDPDTDTVVITHRWIEELVCTDLPFNAYGHYEDECDD